VPTSFISINFKESLLWLEQNIGRKIENNQFSLRGCETYLTILPLNFVNQLKAE